MADISVDYVRIMVKNACDLHGGQAAFARKLKLSRSHINGIISGRKEPYASVLDHFGLERVTVIRRKK